MNNQQQELLYDLLTSKAIYGLDSDDESRLGQMTFDGIDRELASLELAAAAISVAACDIDEPMPAHLRSRILKSYGPASSSAPVAAIEHDEKTAPIGTRSYEPAADAPSSGTSWFGWLGWAAAAAAGIALAFNVFNPPPTVNNVASGGNGPQPTIQRELTLDEKRDRLIASGASVVKAVWGAGNVKEIAQISGDVVWSDAEQTGYMVFKGLPVNDKSKEQYQLWIFEDGKLEPHPKDGGVFDITSDGEVIVPINAKLATKAPKVFAITIEPPGGVVVSKREKIAALAKVEV